MNFSYKIKGFIVRSQCIILLLLTLLSSSSSRLIRDSNSWKLNQQQKFSTVYIKWFLEIKDKSSDLQTKQDYLQQVEKLDKYKNLRQLHGQENIIGHIKEQYDPNSQDKYTDTGLIIGSTSVILLIGGVLSLVLNYISKRLHYQRLLAEQEINVARQKSTKYHNYQVIGRKYIFKERGNDRSSSPDYENKPLLRGSSYTIPIQSTSQDTHLYVGFNTSQDTASSAKQDISQNTSQNSIYITSCNASQNTSQKASQNSTQITSLSSTQITSTSTSQNATLNTSQNTSWNANQNKLGSSSTLSGMSEVGPGQGGYMGRDLEVRLFFDPAHDQFTTKIYIPSRSQINFPSPFFSSKDLVSPGNDQGVLASQCIGNFIKKDPLVGKDSEARKEESLGREEGNMESKEETQGRQEGNMGSKEETQGRQDHLHVKKERGCKGSFNKDNEDSIDMQQGNIDEDIQQGTVGGIACAQSRHDSRQSDEVLLKSQSVYQLAIAKSQMISQEDISNDEKACLVCLEEYDEGDIVIQPSCGHPHHDKCLERWLRKGHPTCPVCRNDLKIFKRDFHNDVLPTSSSLDQGAISFNLERQNQLSISQVSRIFQSIKNGNVVSRAISQQLGNTKKYNIGKLLVANKVGQLQFHNQRRKSLRKYQQLQMCEVSQQVQSQV